MKNKKVAIIGTAGVPARYGGFETLVHHLIQNLSSKFEFSVYCSKKLYEKDNRPSHWKGARLYYLPFSANGVQSIIYDIISIFHALFYADTLLILGVSGGILIPFVKIFTRKNIVVNIDGLEWRRGKWNFWIKKFLKFSEYLAVKFSDADITDNGAIMEYTAKNYGTLSYLVEYGGDHAVPQKLECLDYKEFPFLKRQYVFKVCRIEPENNVTMILNAFSKMPSKQLVVVGNWDSSEYGVKLRNAFKKYKNLFLLDPIYEQKTLDKLRSNCYLYIHGHSAGGTNPSLVEAMNLGLPIFCYDVSFNRYTTENKAIYFRSSKDIINAISSIKYQDLMYLSKRLFQIAKRRYTWELISRKYEQLILGFNYSYTKKPVQYSLSSLEQQLLRSWGIAHLNNYKPKLNQF